MMAFEFTVGDPMGLHARPAARLVKESAKYASRIVLSSRLGGQRGNGGRSGGRP